MNEATETCPKCGSEHVSGLVAAFWTSVSDPERDWQPNSEMGPDRHCGDCEHEWDAGDSPDEDTTHAD